MAHMDRPNLLFILSDQHRATATGFDGNPDVRTPNLDALAREGVVFRRAISNVPVCSPARACLMTGQYALAHRVIVNDVPLESDAVHFAEALRSAGYRTGYIGKWHLAGGPWRSFIPPQQRKGFDFWRVCECTHDYNDSHYHAEEPGDRSWDGYDVFVQTNCAAEYIRAHARDARPFALFLAYGPPHDPYDTAPAEFRAGYEPAALTLRPNVPASEAEDVRQKLAGYYAHVTAIDEAVGRLVAALRGAGLFDNTVLIYTSDHGDMLGSQGRHTKEKPWDESVRVPFVLSWPGAQARTGMCIDQPLGSIDVMPTVLSLCGVTVPMTAEGVNYAPLIRGEPALCPEGVLFECIQPFGSWGKIYGGREFRGLRTRRYTYVRDRQGPWLLYDDSNDPYQMTNLCADDRHADTQRRLDALLRQHIAARGDRFLPGEAYMERFGYECDETGRVPIRQA